MQLTSQSLTVWGGACTGAVTTSTAFSSGVRIRGQKSSMGGPQGRGESFPFFFFSLLHKQAVKNTLPSAGRMSLFAFNCTFQQICQLLLCHLFARGWGVKGGYPKCALGEW